MSQRQTGRKARTPKPRIFLTVARGERIRCIAMRPAVFYACCAMVPIALIALAAFGSYYVFHDDLVVAATIRQAEMQYDYEDRIAALRSELDEAAALRRSEQVVFAARAKKIVAHQAQIESRIDTLQALGTCSGSAASEPAPALNASTPTNPIEADNAVAAIAALSHLPAPADPAGSALPNSVASFATVQLPAAMPASNKPRPETLELSPEGAKGNQAALDPSFLVPSSPKQELAAVQASLDRDDTGEFGQLATVDARAQATVSKISKALAEAGLSPQRFATGAAAEAGAETGAETGAPYVPVSFEEQDQPFADAAARDGDVVALADQLTAALPSIPLRKPLAGRIEVTSPFGERTDPFLGKPELHTGVDLYQSFGTDVHATAAGTVVRAAPDAGYGNLVEIDHGHGLITRYAHLSAILVSQGDRVAAGAVVGRLGSTGRSTGPHLHYEVRIDGRPVDPMPFLEAGAKLFDDGP